MADNSVTLVGNITREPELRYTNGGQAVTSFAEKLKSRCAVLLRQNEREDERKRERLPCHLKSEISSGRATIAPSCDLIPASRSGRFFSLISTLFPTRGAFIRCSSPFRHTAIPVCAMSSPFTVLAIASTSPS